ncbi:MAG: polysulfide reductase NrfD [Actinomycetota bacterium]|nr:polysulfide reductase NrfD [Actinomycetota bacterium]
MSQPSDRPGGEVRSYHGQPVIKEPVWTWEIPVYFFAGGLSGASAGLALLAEARGNEILGRRAWAASMVGIGVSPGLLISDLGRPLRFLNMLRMFKVTSPMSVGSWILSGSGATTTLAALTAWTGVFPRAGIPAKVTAAALGLPLSTYTAALIANTAVPVWHEARRELPFVFGAGAALSAAAAAIIATPTEHAAPARRLALGAAVAELALEELMEMRLGDHGQPYQESVPARFKRLSQACIAAGATLLAARGSRSRAAAAAAGALLGAGAMATRWSIFKAGSTSATDPRYVIGPQRAGIERGERTGAARGTSTVEHPDARTASPATSDHHQPDLDPEG